MRRHLLLALPITLWATASAAASLTVPANQSRPVVLRGVAASVVVGDPAVADVNLIDQRTLLILGKSYGVTNVVVLDRTGRTLFDSRVVVSADDAGQVSLHRGVKSVEYACAQRCEKVSKADGNSGGAGGGAATPGVAANP